MKYWRSALWLVPHDDTVTSTKFQFWAVKLLVAESGGYGGPLGLAGEYTFDPGKHCSGTIDAYLFAKKADPSGGGVHVVGRFLAA